jgi:DNA-binding XRE family transcriptional regulator
MTSQHSKDTETKVEKLLHQLGTQGLLFEDLADEDIETMLANASSVFMSEAFQNRARIAMRDAQKKRVSAAASNALGMYFLRAREQMPLDLEQVAKEVGVDVAAIVVLEMGQLKPNQIMHNFPAATMLRLLRKLQIQVIDFTKIFMELVENTGSVSSFAEVQTAHRKHTPDDAGSLVEATDYIARIERLDRGN